MIRIDNSLQVPRYPLPQYRKAYDKLNVAGSKSTETPAKTATAKADTAKTDTAKATTAKTDTAKADSGLEETKGKPLSDSPLIIAGMIFVVVWSVVMTAVSFRSRDQWFIKGCRWWYAGSVIGQYRLE